MSATSMYAIDPERALPTTAYRERSHPTDLAAVFHDDWVFVATADQVAEPGDWVAVTVGSQPVIVLRRQDGSLAAMSNLCAHRGTLLVDGAGHDKRFQCPYHAWTYGDTGRLLAVPHAERHDVDREAHCLPTYRAEEWHGFVFASLRTDVEPLDERLAHLDDIVGATPIDSLHHWTDQRDDEVWHANWKLSMANAMESYHLFKVHPETLEPYSPTAGAYYIVGAAAGTATGGRTAPDGDSDYILLSLPPNLVAVISGGALLWQAVYPIAHDRCRIVTGAAYASPSPSKDSGVRRWAGSVVAKAVSWAVPDFLPEDKAICERGQLAADGDYTPGVLLPIEQVVVDFHHYLDHRLHGASVPPPRTGAEVGIARPEGVSA